MSLTRLTKVWGLRPQVASRRVQVADLTDADTSQTFAFADALPTNALVIGSWVSVATEVLSSDAATAASKIGGAETYTLDAGDTVVVDVDNGGNQTATWDAAAGYVVDNTYFPIADQDGLTVEVTVDGGTPQTVTLATPCTTEAQCRTQINAQLTGVSVTQDSSVEKAATKVCDAETYSLVDGDTMVIDTDDGGNETITFNAASGDVTDTTTYPVADQDGLTEKVTIDGGTEQTVTFSGATTTATHVADQMNAQLTGCYVSVVGGQVKIVTDKKGTGASVAIGTGTCALTWGTPNAGTGDAADSTAVTAAEIETLVEGDSLVEVSVAAGVPTLSSPTTGASSELDFISGTMLAKLGLSVETIVGTAAQIKITSDKEGTDSTVAISGGTSAMVWSSAVDGTGDVADISAVTAAEVETVIEADTDAEVTVNGNGTFTITSPTTGVSSELDFISGDALTPLGLSVETITGEASVSGTATADMGINGGDLDVFIDGADVTSATGVVQTPQGAAPVSYQSELTPALTVIGSVNVNTLEQGDITGYLVYLDLTKAL